MDEPTNGLDPAGIEEIRTLLQRLADDGVTVLVSSHLLGEIDKTATMLGILSGGRLVFQGTRRELLAASTPDTVLTCSDPRAAARLAPPDSTLDEHGQLVIPGLDDRGTAGVVAALVAADIGVFELRRSEQTLDDVFADLTAGGAL